MVRALTLGLTPRHQLGQNSHSTMCYICRWDGSPPPSLYLPPCLRPGSESNCESTVFTYYIYRGGELVHMLSAKSFFELVSYSSLTMTSAIIYHDQESSVCLGSFRHLLCVIFDPTCCVPMTTTPHYAKKF